MPVSFELERFEWTPDDELLVVGRWIGVHGRRLGKPLLTVEAGGRRHRMRGEATGLEPDDEWRATFHWTGERGDVPGAELEVGSVVVELPAPRRRRRRPSAAGAESELQATVAQLRAELDTVREELKREELARAPDNDELAGLRLAHGSLRAAHEKLEDELEELRAIRDERDAALGEVERLRSEEAEHERVKADLAAVIQELQATRERLTTELDDALAEIERLQNELADAEQRVDRERATTTEVHSRLATAREEAQKTVVAEAEETERLRAELQSSREESERALATERAEVARLREELVDRRTGTDEDGEAPRRELERVSRDLERERAATRTLRRELDELRSQTAEQRREVSNGTIAMRTPEGTQRRVDAARVASTHRVPPHAPSPAGQWAVRAGAAALIAIMIVALVFLVTLVL